MAPPIYFLPGIDAAKFRPTGGKIADGLLADRRLDRVLADVPLGRMMVSNLHVAGPGGDMGLLLRAEPAAGGTSPRFDYKPDEQSWQRVVDPENPDRTLHWIGIDKAEPPKPNDLVRVDQIEGSLVKLADGQQWKVPLIRRPPTLEGGQPHVTKLPCGVQFGFDTSELHIRREYQGIWTRSARVFDIIWCAEPTKPSEGSLLNLFALDCLAINYRVGPFEANALALFDTDTVRDVVEVAIGIAYFEELKKN